MPKASSRKRGQGRPTDGGVGRQAIIDSVKKLLREMAPASITISLVAREAGVDPALVRYYFQDRSNLLMEVVNDLLQGVPTEPQNLANPEAAIVERIHQAHKFTRSAQQMQRLMIDELANSKSEEVRQKHREINLRAIAIYRSLLAGDGGTRLRQVNPMFLYFTVVGIFDFFVSAEPMVRLVTPPETDMDELGSEFTDFVVDLLLNGLLNKSAPEPGQK